MPRSDKIISLVIPDSCSYVSGISLLGLPAEMYTYGAQLWTITLSEWAVSLTIAVIYLPVFYNLQITSAYEVSHRMFQYFTRFFISVIYLLLFVSYY